MTGPHTFAGAMYLLQIFASAFLAILFLQSGIDRRAVLRATDAKGLCRSSCPRSLFLLALSATYLLGSK